MTENLVCDFSVDKKNKTINIKREFAAELPIVWEAFSKKDILEKWWAPKPWKAKTKTMDFREGGHWHYAMVGPEGEQHWGMTNYTRIHPQKDFEGVDSFVDENGKANNGLPVSTWKVNFTDQGKTTIVTFKITFDDVAQLDKQLEMGFKEGMLTAMEGLDDVLPTLKKNK